MRFGVPKRVRRFSFPPRNVHEFFFFYSANYAIMG
jgi:hypothetical protein